MIDLVKNFGGKDGEQQNALFTAIVNASHTWIESNMPEGKKMDFAVFPDDQAVYPYLAGTPKASLTVELVDELNKLGYEIKKK